MFDERSGRLYFMDDLGSNQEAAQLSRSSSTDAHPRKPRVLVVDDEKRIADNLCKILKLSGFDAAVAYDGWSALESVAALRPDYVLSDVLMPRMNGVELAIAVTKSCPGAKVLLFSGQAGISEILDGAKKQGFIFQLVAKPIHPLKLIERLKAL